MFSETASCIGAITKGQQQDSQKISIQTSPLNKALASSCHDNRYHGIYSLLLKCFQVLRASSNFDFYPNPCRISPALPKAFAKSLRSIVVFLIDVAEKPKILKSFRQCESRVFRNQQLYWGCSKDTVTIQGYMLTIYTNHPGENRVQKHKTIQFDVVGKRPATNYTQIS